MENLACEPVVEMLCPVALLRCPKCFPRTNMNAGVGTHSSFLFGSHLLSFSCPLALARTSCPELSRTDCPFLYGCFQEETSVILLSWDRFSVLSDWGSPGLVAHALSVYCGLDFPFWPYSTHLPCFSDDSHLPAPSPLLYTAFFPCLFTQVFSSY